MNAVVRHFSPNGTPTTVVTCATPEAVVNAVARGNPADAVKIELSPDVLVSNLGTIWTFDLHTRRARGWWRRFVAGDLVVEHRYGPDIVEGLRDAGLVVSSV